jgi:cephalosporin hydroxylase
MINAFYKLHADRDRPVNKWSHYLAVYQDHLNRFVNQTVTMLEIGIGFGGSLDMFANYLGPYAQIVGLDIRPSCADYQTEQIKVVIGDQSDSKVLRSLINEFTSFDIIIDDGSHRPEHYLKSFVELWPFVSNNGVYIIEDVGITEKNEVLGGLRFLQFLINEQTNPSYADIRSISMHAGIVVIEKGTFRRKIPTVYPAGSQPWTEGISRTD